MIDIPSLRKLAADALAGIAATFGAVPRTSRTILHAFARAAALLLQEVHRRQAWLWRQSWASTADDPRWLARHGYELGLVPKTAARASGTATASCTTGVVVPAGLRYTRSDGAGFVTSASAVASAGSVTLPFQAERAGTAGNTNAAETLTLADGAAPAGLGATATVTVGGLGGGAEAEGVEDFRARVLARKRSGGETGKAGDWRRWASEVPGVPVQTVFVDSFVDDTRRVWLAPLVIGRTNGVPSGGDLGAVQAYLNDPERRPVTARVSVVAVTPVAVDVTIGGLSPDTPAIRAEIAAELAAVFATRARPCTPSATAIFSRSWIAEAISRATGEDRHRLVAPSADVTLSTPPQMPVLGAITYTA